MQAWKAREPQLPTSLTSRHRWANFSHRYSRHRMNTDDQLYLVLKAKLKSASRAIMSEPDWAANMEIVDMCNEKPAYLPHISHILKKRICHWNPNVGYLALVLIEALVKNCPAFHPFVTQTDFVDAMMKELYRKKEKKTLLQHIQLQQQNVSEVSRLQRKDKILLLIESWAESAKISKSFDIYRVTFNDLKRQGFSFPVPLKDEKSPVFTPQAKPRVRFDADDSSPVRDQKLQDDLANIEVFMDTLNEADPDQSLTDNEIVQILKAKLESAQNKIMERIASDPSEDLMNELLIVNDEVCQALEYYSKVVSGKIKSKKRTGPKPIRGKGQRVSAVDPNFADLLHVANLPAAPDYASESEDDSPENSDDSENESDADSKQADQSVSKDKRLVDVPKSNGNGKEMINVAKGIAPPRSKNKARAIKNTESNESKDLWSKDSPTKSDNPFDILDSQMKPDNAASKTAGPNPFATGDELLTSLAVIPNKNPNPRSAQKKPDLSFFDPL